MVHRPDRLIDIIETFRKYKIEPKRMRLVYPRIHREANVLLIEGIKGERPETFELKILYSFMKMKQVLITVKKF